MKYDFENAPCGYLSFYPDGTIEQVNQTFLKWTGYQKAEVENIKKLEDITPKGTILYFQMFVYPLLKLQGFVNEISVDILSADGTSISCLYNASLIRKEDGNIRHIHAILFSIAERKKYEAEILKAKKIAEELAAHKEHILQVQRRIMSILGHDTRAPLFSINRLIKLAADGRISPEDMVPNFELIANQLDATLILINDLLTWSYTHFNSQNTEEVCFSLRSVTDDVFELMAGNALAKGLYLDNKIDAAVNMHAHRSMVTFIIRNLVSNAIKFTSRGGITVTAATPNGDVVQITVKDTGVGMTPEQLQKYRLGALISATGTAGEKGSGMGMVLINEFLLQFKGSMLADSDPGKGTTVTVLLPLSPEQANEFAHDTGNYTGSMRLPGAHAQAY